MWSVEGCLLCWAAFLVCDVCRFDHLWQDRHLLCMYWCQAWFACVGDSVCHAGMYCRRSSISILSQSCWPWKLLYVMPCIAVMGLFMQLSQDSSHTMLYMKLQLGAFYL